MPGSRWAWRSTKPSMCFEIVLTLEGRPTVEVSAFCRQRTFNEAVDSTPCEGSGKRAEAAGLEPGREAAPSGGAQCVQEGGGCLLQWNIAMTCVGCWPQPRPRQLAGA